MEAATLIKILSSLVKKYNIKLNDLKNHPLSRHELEPNIWNEANMIYYKKKFEYKNSLKIKQWWVRKQGILKKHLSEALVNFETKKRVRIFNQNLVILVFEFCY